MQKLQGTDWFGILWIVLGLIHASFFLVGIRGYNHFLYVFGFASLVIFPLRYWLIEKVLGLQLEGWAWWTAIGTGLACALAAAVFWISLIVSFICCYNFSFGSDSNFFTTLLIFSFYPVFRASLLGLQARRIPKFKKSTWMIENLLGTIVVWLALAFLNPEQPAFGAFLTIVAVAISELITVHSLLTIKSRNYEDKKEKLKVEEM